MKTTTYLVMALLIVAVFIYGCRSGNKGIAESNGTNASNESLAPLETPVENQSGSMIDQLVVNRPENTTIKSNETNLTPDTLVPENKTEEKPGGIVVNFIDVGNGDSVFIKTSKNATMLVDGGPNDAASAVISMLRAEGISSMLDVMIATHPDSEAVGGLDAVAYNLAAISQTYDNGVGSESQDYAGFEQFSKAKGFFNVVKEDMSFNLDDHTAVQLIVPYADGYMNNSDDNSLVVKLTYSKISILLMGDCTLECEKKIMGHDLKADVLLAGHNGGEDATSQELLDNVKPKLAIVSVGKYNEGYPSTAVLERLSNNSIETLRTDLNGTIVVKTDGETFTARASK